MTLLALSVSFLVTFISAFFLRRLAVYFGFLDHPESRKQQKEPVPLLGGAAVYAGIIAGSFIVPLYGERHLILFLASSVIFIVSLVDDRVKLSAQIRIMAQLLAAALVMGNGLRVSFLPNHPVGDALEVVITLIWILGMTNAFNYIDGIDGACAGLASIASFFFLAVLFLSGQFDFVFLPAALLGASLGFLPHNFRKKKMFLGDSGSMLLGFTLAVLSLTGNWASDDIIKLSVPVLILGVPIFDMSFTTVMRIKEKKIRSVVEWLAYAGRDHFHHYLLDLGLRSRGAAYFIFAVSVSMGINAVVIAESKRSFFGILMLSEAVILFGLVGVLMVLGRRFQKEQLVRDRMGF